MNRPSTRRSHLAARLAAPILGLLGLALPPSPAEASPIANPAKSGGIMGDLKGLGRWFQHQQNNFGSILDFSGAKAAHPGNTLGTPTTAGHLETAVGSLSPAQVHALALAAVKQDPSLSPVDGLIPHNRRVVALEKQRDLDPTQFDADHPKLGLILSRDEALRSNMTPLVTTQSLNARPLSAEVIAPSPSATVAAEVISGGSATVVPEPGGASIALAMIGAVGLWVRVRGRRLGAGVAWATP